MFARVPAANVRPMSKHSRLVAATTVALAALAVPALAASGRVWVVSSPSCILTGSITRAQEQYKPQRIVIGCSQHESSYYAKLFAKGLRWSKWTGSTAIASGTLEAGSCSPSCKRGRLAGYSVQMTLAGPKKCPGAAHKLFTTATFTFSHKQPAAPTGEGTYALPCGGAYAAPDIRRAQHRA
jgi:hypothetical protein